jgi:hypothetical protein
MILFVANKTGSAGGYTGSPGDNSNTCVSCHGGTANSVSGWITTNIPETGYSPGEVYVITLTATDANAGRFGFEITAEDEANNKIPNFNLTNVNDTKLTNAGKAITHTITGTDKVGDGKIWSFEWTAPEVETGPVTFYAAINAANDNGFNSGDKIYKTSTTISFDASSVEELSDKFIFYPNPSTGLINFNSPNPSGKWKIIVVNNNGQEVENLSMNGVLHQADLSHLPKGWYVIKLTDGTKTSLRKLLLY